MTQHCGKLFSGCLTCPVSDHCTDVCNSLDQPACYSNLGPQFGHHSDLAPRCIQCHSSTHSVYDTSLRHGSTGKISAFTVRTRVGSCSSTDFSTYSLCMHWNLITCSKPNLHAEPNNHGVFWQTSMCPHAHINFLLHASLVIILSHTQIVWEDVLFQKLTVVQLVKKLFLYIILSFTALFTRAC
jgi:hypothetical protein